MNEFEKHLKKVLNDLKQKVDNGQDIDSTIDTEADKLAELLLKEKFDDIRNDPEKNKTHVIRALKKLQDEYSIDDTLIIFRGREDGCLTGLMQGDLASIAAGIGYIIHKSKLPKKIILDAIDFMWEDEKT
jgi:hypothetical protein